MSRLRKRPGFLCPQTAFSWPEVYAIPLRNLNGFEELTSGWALTKITASTLLTPYGELPERLPTFALRR
jgi:hypothetical protein